MSELINWWTKQKFFEETGYKVRSQEACIASKKWKLGYHYVTINKRTMVNPKRIGELWEEEAQAQLERKVLQYK